MTNLKTYIKKPCRMWASLNARGCVSSVLAFYASRGWWICSSQRPWHLGAVQKNQSQFFLFADGRSSGRLLLHNIIIIICYYLLSFIFISELICLSEMCFDLKSLSCQTSRPEEEWQCIVGYSPVVVGYRRQDWIDASVGGGDQLQHSRAAQKQSGPRSPELKRMNLPVWKQLDKAVKWIQ